MDLVERLGRRVGNMLIAAVLRSDALSGGAHRGQFSGRAGEGKDGVRILTPYGFAMRLIAGGDDVGPETVILAVEPDLRYALPPSDSRYQPDDLEAGEVALYTDEDKSSAGCRLHFKRGRLIKIICDTAQIVAETKVRMETPLLEVTGDVIDNCGSQQKSMKDMRDAYNPHVHEDPQGGKVGVPSPQI